MRKTARGLRTHIALFGRRNVGKSSLLNALTRQRVSLVSAEAGTTSDPVEKPMELLPIGPVLFIDTAGIDDVGSLGESRVEGTRKVFERTDIAILVAEGPVWGPFEETLLEELKARGLPLIVVFNKMDLGSPAPSLLAGLEAERISWVHTVAQRSEGIMDLRQALIDAVPEELLASRNLFGELLGAGELVLFVVPIDLEAPKGRLILAQVQAIRDALDNEASCLVVKERGLVEALRRLKEPPALVVTDSQVIEQVAADTPQDVLLTSFSILFARLKGDLNELARGAMAIDELAPGDRILVAEACTHHPISDDIGTVKIPRWISGHVGGELHVDHVQGRDWPSDLSPYKLVIHCGACVWNRKQMLSRILECRGANVPITNYGLAISKVSGVFERALAPFRFER